MATQPTHTICIIDDEAPLREVVRRYLEHDGFHVIEAESGTHALTLLQKQAADLLLLDIMLPGIDGFRLMRILRTAGASPSLTTASGVPVIMLTSRGDESDRITGFELGVDDYVTKPFSPRELVARIKAVLRRAYPEAEKSERPLQYGMLLLDPIRRMVRLDDRTLVLTAREFDLLWLLAQHPQQVFTRDQLLDRVWGYEFDGDDSTVTVHIRRLREKLERDPSNPIFIQTVWGVGYKFDPPLETP
jgi:DNA-binding response OmpR family regulator